MENEEELVSELHLLCKDNGVEKNKKETAKVLHRLGVVYAGRSPNKICLIQSAVLLNAALIRQPDNAGDIKLDLHKLCSKILRLANSKNCDANLLEISESIRQSIVFMRDNVEDQLSKVKKIPMNISEKEVDHLQQDKIKKMVKLQDFITEKYIEIMRSVAEQVVHIVGNIPCKFALVGMGSLARREITPYSDFENIIVLDDSCNEDDDALYEKFRWFAVIFQIVLVNLGETLIPSVAIPSLNDFQSKHSKNNWFYDDFTKSGISFDGFMPFASKSPIGQVYKTENRDWELIKKASAMAKYLESEEDLKNGYHLADVLASTCFVYGDECVYESFNSLSTRKLDDQRNHSSQFYKMLSEQVEMDERSFNVWKSLENLHRNLQCDMKRVVYRSSTVFLSALGKLYGIHSSSCFVIVRELAKRNLISAVDEHKLLFAVAVACEVRLRVYMEKGRQSNLIQKNVSETKGYVSELLSIIGEKTTVDYFNITHSLQSTLPQFSMGTSEKTINCEEIQFTIPGIYYFLEMYEKSVEAYRDELSRDPDNDDKKVYALFRIGYSFYQLKQYRDAIQEFNAVAEILNRDPSIDTGNVVMHKSRVAMANCYCSLKMYNESLEQYDLVPGQLKTLADMNNRVIVYLKLGHYERAIKSFNDCIDFVNNKSTKEGESKESKKSMSVLHHNIGRCLYEQGKYADALEKLQQAEQIRKSITLKWDQDHDLSLTTYNIGRCHLMMGELEKAESFLESALKVQTELPPLHAKPSVADTLHYLARHRFNCTRYTDALDFLKRELDIRKQLPVEQNTNRDDLPNCRKLIEDCKAKIRTRRKRVADWEDSD